MGKHNRSEKVAVHWAAMTTQLKPITYKITQRKMIENAKCSVLKAVVLYRLSREERSEKITNELFEQWREINYTKMVRLMIQYICFIVTRCMQDNIQEGPPNLTCEWIDHWLLLCNLNSFWLIYRCESTSCCSYSRNKPFAGIGTPNSHSVSRF